MKPDGEGPIISAVTFDVKPDTLDEVVRVAGMALQQTSANIKGFIEGVVLVDEAKSHIIIETEWESRDSWAHAEWDRTIEDTLAHLYQDTASYNLRFYFPLVRARKG